MKGAGGKFALLLLIVAAIVAFFLFDLGRFLTIGYLREQQGALAGLLAREPVLVIGGFFVAYVAVTALSLPGAAIMTLASGAVFGLMMGTVIVSFASAIGAALAFLSARYLLRDWVKARFPSAVRSVDAGVAKDGNFYLLTLRLIPIFPFFLVNLAMGLTSMRLVPYFVVSQIGMLAGTIVFVNAGTQLAAIESTGDILSPALIGSFALLGMFPLVAKWAIDAWKRRNVYAGWTKPKHFDRNLIVIGAGAGGLVTAYIAATVKAKVTLIEKARMGGDCLNTGCVPSKALIRSARLAHEMRNADAYGLTAADTPVRFASVMARVRKAIRIIEPADSIERYTELGVDVRQGHGTLVDPWTVAIDGGERLTARAIVIAAGGEPQVPDIPGIKESGYLTSDTLWDALDEREAVPDRLVVIGGGPIGCELAHAFARLGSNVVQVEGGARILPREDAEVSAFIADALRADGVDLRLGEQAQRIEGKALMLGNDTTVPFDELIVAVGRTARIEGYGLETLGIETGKTLQVDDFLRTRFPNIFAVGDVAGPYQFTHFAAHQAWFAAVNALFGRFRTFRADYSVLPWVTFTDPEVAHVGHNEQSALEGGIAYEVVRYDLSHLDRAVAEGTNAGFVKLLVQPGKDRILGATIVAHNAGEMIAEFVLAMKHGIGLNKILGTIKAYPTMAEANKYAAGEWKKARKPERVLRLIERYHDWMRT
ncbi:pyridine nucleotide-disulfide oxidoreductase [Sphingomonas suaedae]|uniref:Pyridine nucleotide-disulfide oxidoreductase n=1 Tax=Sphingomonas suaedae TaxID=2599297 RepID=A0A518RHR2_9SPHN|nr:bifunctional TVP38/TMEM64 family protein/FAD-dependent oxidoreductase [Sphingomonas suaedae]QDX26971.1 pyridine nucleotide-disulfide oxidoreductase [Sphingomonas suaedae]